MLLLWLAQGSLVSNSTRFEHRSSVHLGATQWSCPTGKMCLDSPSSQKVSECLPGSLCSPYFLSTWQWSPRNESCQAHSAQSSHAAVPLDRLTNLVAFQTILKYPKVHWCKILSRWELACYIFFNLPRHTVTKCSDKSLWHCHHMYRWIRRGSAETVIK